MGSILKIQKFTTGFEILIVFFSLVIISGGIYWFAPGLRVIESKQLESMEIDKGNIDNVSKTAMLELPTTVPSIQAAKNPLVTIAGYAWNAETPIITANGGPRTTKGSLMEKNGVNLSIVRQDWLSELRNMQMKFIEQYNEGEEFPSSDKAAFGIIIMGDGAPFYISTMQSALNKKFGKDKYHVKVVGAMGLSFGEDKLIGPPEWKTNPQSMLGSLISTVPGDGDWVVALNFAFANHLKVNPDFTTYDPNAVNFVPAANDDYAESAKLLIASQNNGTTVPLKEVINGKLTGKTINKKVDGTSTWTPADKAVFDALTGFTDIASTKDFNNQMAATLIVVEEWAKTHPTIISNILKSTFTAANQLKQHDSWAIEGANAVASTYKLETGKYWYDMFKGQSGSKGGVTFNMGGSKIFNYADALQYYGITDGTNRYKSVYNQVSAYLTELNPGGFNESVEGGVVPYDQAVDLSYLKNVNDVESGSAEKADYKSTKTEVFASGNWAINFATGSAEILPSSTSDLNSVYNLLIQAENSKLKVVGHTDNTGNPDINLTLSEKRANSVVEWLLAKGISVDRVQDVQGLGDTKPIADNKSATGKSKNRRVEISLLH
jgi:OOP family OmpA-OmpF porin